MRLQPCDRANAMASAKSCVPTLTPRPCEETTMSSSNATRSPSAVEIVNSRFTMPTTWPSCLASKTAPISGWLMICANPLNCASGLGVNSSSCENSADNSSLRAGISADVAFSICMRRSYSRRLTIRLIGVRHSMSVQIHASLLMKTQLFCRLKNTP